MIVTSIYPAREKPIPGVSGEMIVDEFSRKDSVIYIEQKSDVPEFLKKIVLKGDLIITMGAGDIGEICNSLLDLLN